MNTNTKKWAKRVAIGSAALLIAMQLVPYGRDHDNPAVAQEPKWDSERTRELAKTACFDCHSNETEWPWYSNIAPVSWLVQHDVDEGREHLNFSEFNKEQDDADEAAHEVEEGEMPLAVYTWTHGEARLSAEDRQALIKGLRATFGDK